MILLKRTLLILTTAILVAVFFTKASSPSLKTNENRESFSQLPPYHIKWYHVGLPRKDLSLVFEEVSKYTLKKINASVEMRIIEWENYDEELESIIASGENFDLCFTAAYCNYVQNVARGAFVELDPLIEKYGQGVAKLINPVFFKGSRIKGKLYALPANKEIAHQSALIFNKKYVDKYSFDLSKINKLGDLDPYLKTIKEKEPDIIPYAIESKYNNSFSLPFDRIIEGVPGALYYDNRTGYKIVNELDTPEYKEYFNILHSWHKEGYILKESYSYVRLDEYLQNGNWFASAISYTPNSDDIFSYSSGYEIEVVPLNSPVTENRDCRGSMLAISSSSKNPDRAMMFLELLNTDKYLYNLVTFGIEEKHYFKIDENTIKTPEGINEFTASYQLAPFTTGNIMLCYILSPCPQTMYEDYQNFNNSASCSPLLGFDFDPTNVKNEISALLSVSDEFEGPLKTGAIDSDIYLPKAIEKYKSAGLDKLIEEEQKQLNQWILKNGQ